MKSRRVLWMSTGHKGSTHDSKSFIEAQLYRILEEESDWLEDKAYFLVGDSAYPLMPPDVVDSHDISCWPAADRAFEYNRRLASSNSAQTGVRYYAAGCLCLLTLAR